MSAVAVSPFERFAAVFREEHRVVRDLGQHLPGTHGVTVFVGIDEIQEQVAHDAVLLAKHGREPFER